MILSESTTGKIIGYTAITIIACTIIKDNYDSYQRYIIFQKTRNCGNPRKYTGIFDRIARYCYPSYFDKKEENEIVRENKSCQCDSNKDIMMQSIDNL